MASIVAAWPTVPLGEVLTQFTEYIDVPEPRMYSKLSVKLYGKGVVLDTPADGTVLKMQRHQCAKAGQVILSEIWGKKGAIGIVPPEGEGALCTSHFFLFDMRHDTIDPRWLQAIFSANFLQDQLDSEARGTTGYAAVRPKNLQSATIPLPPLDEQRRIVARIEEMATRIEEAKGLRQEAMAETGDFVSSLHLALAGDCSMRLDDVLMLDELREGVIPGKVYPQVGLKGFGGGLFVRETLDSAETSYKAFNRLYEGAIVLSQVKGWEGAIAGCDARFADRYVSPEYRTFRCKPGVAIPEYMAALVVTPWFWSHLTSMTRGVGARREHTRPEQFLRLVVPMPTVDQQAVAIRTLGKLDALAQLQRETSAELDALLPSVLHKAFRGEL
jgi:type I restriction enzyme, S subunit